MRVVCVIQARLGSSRFPHKALAELNGVPLIVHVVERAQQIKGIDGIVVACPDSDTARLSDIIRPYDRLDARVSVCGHSGDDSDVLGRFAAVAGAAIQPVDALMRLTGDCVLLDPDVSSLVLKRFKEEGADFASNDVNESGYPDGFDTEVFTRELLERAHREATSAYDREHVTPIMKRLVGVRSTLVRCVPRHPWADIKLSIDTPEDLARVQNLLSQPSSPRRARRDA